MFACLRVGRVLEKSREHVFSGNVLEFIHFRSRKHGTLAGQIQLDVSLGQTANGFLFLKSPTQFPEEPIKKAAHE